MISEGSDFLNYEYVYIDPISISSMVSNHKSLKVSGL